LTGCLPEPRRSVAQMWDVPCSGLKTSAMPAHDSSRWTWWVFQLLMKARTRAIRITICSTARTPSKPTAKSELPKRRLSRAASNPHDSQRKSYRSTNNCDPAGYVVILVARMGGGLTSHRYRLWCENEHSEPESNGQKSCCQEVEDAATMNRVQAFVFPSQISSVRDVRHFQQILGRRGLLEAS
jgi:hypothetical protein